MNQPVKIQNLLYDVGMHKGEDTDYYLKKHFKVVAFEANPDLAAHCKRRFAKEIGNGALTIVEGAITEPFAAENQTVKFYTNNQVTEWGTVLYNWAKRNEFLGTNSDIIEVRAINFAQSLQVYGIPHYLKIDIEGADTVCLKALLAFSEKPDYVSIESDKVNFSTLANELDLLTQLGYTGFKAIQQNDISRQEEPNPSQEGGYAGYRFRDGSSGLFGSDLPGRWKSRRQILNEYKITFLLYRLFGDYGKLRAFNRFLTGRIGRTMFRALCGRTIPFWYDTHAKHQSVAS